MPTVQQLTELRQAASKLARHYYHWRTNGYPTDHPHHVAVDYFEALLSNLS